MSGFIEEQREYGDSPDPAEPGTDRLTGLDSWIQAVGLQSTIDDVCVSEWSPGDYWSDPDSLPDALEDWNEGWTEDNSDQ